MCIFICQTQLCKMIYMKFIYYALYYDHCISVCFDILYIEKVVEINWMELNFMRQICSIICRRGTSLKLAHVCSFGSYPTTPDRIYTCSSKWNFRRIHTQERSRFPSRLKYWDIFALVQTSGNISLIAERDDSGHRTAHAWYQALPLFWYARLEWWDRKYQDYLLKRSHIHRDANNHAYSQIIALIPK